MYERKINYYETDKMGIVHHSNYIRFFEEARCEWMNSNGLPYEKLEKAGIQIPVLSAYCEYKTPSTFGDTLVISLNMNEFKGIKMVITYEITNKETGGLVAIGETKHCLVDKDIKPINVKKYNPEVYEIISSWLV